MKRSSPAPVLLTLLTCMVGCLSYIGAIRGGALFTLLMPAALVVSLVGAQLRRLGAPALAVVGILAFVVGQVVNLLSGELQGPAARGTFLAAAASGTAVVLSASKAPALMLLPIGGIVVGALTLGAGGQVQLVAVVTAALALLALASIEREGRAMTTPQRSSVPLILVLVLVGVAGIFAALFHGQSDSREPSAPLRTTINESVRPPSLLSLPDKALDKARTPDLPVVGVDGFVVPEQTDPTRIEQRHGLSKLWLLLLLVPVVPSLVLVVRLVLAAWSWRRHYRRIRRAGDVPAAWAWTVAHLGRVGLAPPSHDSPDRIAEGHLGGVIEPLHEPVRALAVIVSPVVYGAAEHDDLMGTWALAELAADEAWTAAGVTRRCQARWRWAPADVSADR